MGWDPSKRPRKSRFRATKRPFEDCDEFDAFKEKPPQRPLRDQTLAYFERILPPVADREQLRRRLGNVLSNHRLMRANPPSSNEVTRFQLRMIIHLAWKYATAKTVAASSRLNRELERTVASLNKTANKEIRERVRPFNNHYSDGPFLLRSNDEHWTWVATAAGEIEADLPDGGDYDDIALLATVGSLVGVYALSTGLQPTFSRQPSGPVAMGSQRTVAGSACGKFVLAFFNLFEPDLALTRPTNKLREFLSLAGEVQRRSAPVISPEVLREILRGLHAHKPSAERGSVLSAGENGTISYSEFFLGK